MAGCFFSHSSVLLICGNSLEIKASVMSVTGTTSCVQNQVHKESRVLVVQKLPDLQKPPISQASLHNIMVQICQHLCDWMVSNPGRVDSLHKCADAFFSRALILMSSEPHSQFLGVLILLSLQIVCSSLQVWRDTV